ncbi:MAG: MoxR family ATPase [Vicinamibacterales bacterium]
MQFTKAHFDPLKSDGAVVDEQGHVIVRTGNKDTDVYVFSAEIVLAVNVAMVTRRPLLLSGEPGCGKTTLAASAARVLKRTFFRETVTSQTRAVDLLWRFDTLRRLNDAQTPQQPLQERQYYVEPGTLWWAFDPESAERRGKRVTAAPEFHARNPGIDEAGGDAVVLIDEIDKADPDVPNDLLEPFDVNSFTVRETTDPIVRTRNVLLVLTTNGERELPPAFLRRCVALRLPDPTEDWFVTVAERRLNTTTRETPLIREVAKATMGWRQAATSAGVRRPGTAEFLDALLACRELGLSPESPAWRVVANAVLWKNDKLAPVFEKLRDESRDFTS